MGSFKPKVYVKDESHDPIFKQVDSKIFVRTSLVPSILLIFGVFLLVSQVVLPLAFFTTQDQTTLKPVNNSALGVATGFRAFEFAELDSNTPTTPISKVEPDIPDYYYLTIPKLGIEGAAVETTPANLDPNEALGHYIGSALPGEVGNTFIYGHSVLPFFYNPKNYKTIFSTLDQLAPGDMIYIDYNNSKLTYKVDAKRELKPKDVYPLAEVKPKFLNESTLVLMTCSPAGTKINRLLIDATLVAND